MKLVTKLVAIAPNSQIVLPANFPLFLIKPLFLANAALDIKNTTLLNVSLIVKLLASLKMKLPKNAFFATLSVEGALDLTLTSVINARIIIIFINKNVMLILRALLPLSLIFSTSNVILVSSLAMSV